MKKLIVNMLDAKRVELVKERDAYLQKIKKPNDKYNFYTKRIEDSKEILKMILKIDFSNDITLVKEYLSPYGTFCDRKTMYYDEMILSQYDDEHKVQILMCEFFNSLQPYFTIAETLNLPKTLSDNYQSTSFVFMHHIGLISQKISYATDAQQLRNNIVNKFNETYPDNEIISFPPNLKAALYLLNKALNGDPLFGEVKEKIETGTVVEIYHHPNYYNVYAKSGITYENGYTSFRRTYYFDKNTGERLKGTSKQAREHKDAKDLLDIIRYVNEKVSK